MVPPMRMGELWLLAGGFLAMNPNDLAAEIEATPAEDIRAHKRKRAALTLLAAAAEFRKQCAIAYDLSLEAERG